MTTIAPQFSGLVLQVGSERLADSVKVYGTTTHYIDRDEVRINGRNHLAKDEEVGKLADRIDAGQLTHEQLQAELPEILRTLDTSKADSDRSLTYQGEEMSTAELFERCRANQVFENIMANGDADPAGTEASYSDYIGFMAKRKVSAISAWLSDRLGI